MKDAILQQIAVKKYAEQVSSICIFNQELEELILDHLREVIHKNFRHLTF